MKSYDGKMERNAVNQAVSMLAFNSGRLHVNPVFDMSSCVRSGARDNDDNDDDDGDSDDDEQEQSTRLSSELLGKHNRKLPTNTKTLHGRRPNCPSGERRSRRQRQ